MATLEERREQLRREFEPEILEVEEIDDGRIYWFRRSPETLRKVSEFALFESDCCEFLDFGIGLASGGERISLRISGPEGAGGFGRRRPL